MKSQATDSMTRLRLVVTGAVQGVGFRPFVYRLARELALCGNVANDSQGVVIEVEGNEATLEEFRRRLQTELPPRAFLNSVEACYLDAVGYGDFQILHSDDDGPKSALVLPDLATCPDCLREVLTPTDRRYRYPFTNCTNCGPRYSIIESLPYDRANTTMKIFPMCERCRAEYEDPANRRFHAQPNACPECGPQLALWTPAGAVVATRDEALRAAADALRAGQVVAVKGLGGFHLMADATSGAAVTELRRRKRRGDKPLAVMFGDLAHLEQECELEERERRLITAVESPIVLVRKRIPTAVVPAVAPRNPYLGVMLPYTPLHHLLLRSVDRPLVATSGNLSEDPICIDEHDARERLRGIADLFLVHNRPIRRHVDDSIVRAVAGRPQIMRRARGYAPLPVRVQESLPPLAAVGGHLKNCVAIANDHNVFLSQHVGDLETVQSYRAFVSVLSDLSKLYEHTPIALAADLHPDYLSTQFAAKSGLATVPVQHHYAHALACMAENEVEPPVLAVSWDGTGYGVDGTVWGGEFLLIDDAGFTRSAWLRPFQLPGGEAAVREPRRSAAGLLGATFSGSGWQRYLAADCFTEAETRAIDQMLHSSLNSPQTTSAGRLFDGVASLLGLVQSNCYEGEGGMQLEFAIGALRSDERYEFTVDEHETGREIDWRPMLRALLADRDKGIAAATIAARFHNTLVEMIVTTAKTAGCDRVALTGGCFQNTYLAERAIRRLEESGFAVYRHQRVPPNDGGIALGQIIAAARALRKEM